MKHTSIWDEKCLLLAMDTHKINQIHAKTLWRKIIQQNVTDYHSIKDMPKAFLNLLDTQFTMFTSKVIKRSDAKDGSTTKLLIQLQNGKQIESCIMRYGDVEFGNFPEEERDRLPVSTDGSIEFRSKPRATLCVSSQVGCAMACTFCATGTMGLDSNLSAGDIIEQLVHANMITPIKGIVFMGMGEPLDNFSAVIEAIKAFTDTSRFGLSSQRISISTVGIVPRIKQLQTLAPNISLALSLHAPTQEKRLQIVPTSKAYHIDKIMSACDDFIANQNKNKKTPRKILIEYVLIANVNDSIETARELGVLLEGRDVMLNVIPYNKTDVAFDYETPARSVQAEFVAVVREYGVKVILRQTMGDDIASACGQLVIEQRKGCAGDIEDLGKVASLNERKISLKKTRRKGCIVE